MLATIEDVSGQPAEREIGSTQQHQYRTENGDEQADADQHLSNVGHNLILKSETLDKRGPLILGMFTVRAVDTCAGEDAGGPTILNSE